MFPNRAWSIVIDKTELLRAQYDSAVVFRLQDAKQPLHALMRMVRPCERCPNPSIEKMPGESNRVFRRQLTITRQQNELIRLRARSWKPVGGPIVFELIGNDHGRSRTCLDANHAPNCMAHQRAAMSAFRERAGQHCRGCSGNSEFTAAFAVDPKKVTDAGIAPCCIGSFAD